jgi:hypothetical protein
VLPSSVVPVWSWLPCRWCAVHFEPGSWGARALELEAETSRSSFTRLVTGSGSCSTWYELNHKTYYKKLKGNDKTLRLKAFSLLSLNTYDWTTGIQKSLITGPIWWLLQLWSITKWNGRIFAWFTVVHKFPHTYGKKKYSPSGWGWFGNVCPSVCLSDCPSVLLSQRKSAVSFELIGPLFSGAPSLLARNVWAGDPDPVRFRAGPGPGKTGFTGNLSLPWVLGWRGRVIPFWKLEDGSDKMSGAEFWFFAWTRRNGKA